MTQGQKHGHTDGQMDRRTDFLDARKHLKNPWNIQPILIWDKYVVLLAIFNGMAFSPFLLTLRRLTGLPSGPLSANGVPYNILNDNRS